MADVLVQQKTAQIEVDNVTVEVQLIGPVGMSAYESWLGLGNVGDATAFLASLKGSPGGNVMAVNLFVGLTSSTVINSGVDAIRTTGFGAVGRGAAWYEKNDTLVTSGFAAAHPLVTKRLPDENGVFHGFVLDLEQGIRIEMAGGIADAVEPSGGGAATSGTYNDAALNALIALQQVYIYDSNSPYQRTINFGIGGYLFQNPIDLKVSVTLQGIGTGLATHGNGTNLYWPAGTAGIYINTYWTSLGTYNATPTTSAEGTKIRGMRLVGGGNTLDLTKNGIRAHALFELDGVVVENFPGSGLDCTANSGATDGTMGNTNGSVLRNFVGKNNGGHTAKFAGSDCNALKIIGLQSRTAGLCGIFNTSVFGSDFIGIELDGFGDGPTAAYVSTGGKNYIGIDPNASLGAVTPGTDATKWYPDGSEGGGLYPAWVSGHTYNVSLPIYDSGGGSRYFGYQEGHLSHVIGNSIVFGQTIGCTRPSNVFKLVTSGPALGICNQGYGFGFYHGVLATGDARGSQFYGAVFPDPLNNVMATLSYTSNGGWAAKRLLDPTAHAVWQTVDGTNTAFGYTLKSTTVNFGTSAGMEGAFYASKLVVGDGGGNPANGIPMMNSSGAPSSGAVRQGQIFWDRSAAAAGKAGRIVTTAGTIGSTAVLKQFAVIDA